MGYGGYGIWDMGENIFRKKIKIVFFEDDFSKTSKNGGQDLRPFLEIILYEIFQIYQ